MKMNNLTKDECRIQFKNYRKNMPENEKDLIDREIITRILTHDKYYKSDVVLSYVSTDDEINTRHFISAALANRKTVACPICDTENHTMKFLVIERFEDLVEGAYSILAPDENKCREVSQEELKNSICIVPGLGFDAKGQRIGYGKGFYDRFLSDYDGFSIGACYSACFKLKLPCEEHDEPVNMIITEKSQRYILTAKRDSCEPL